MMQVQVERIESDVHTVKTCDICNRVVEEKVTSLVTKQFSEVLGLSNKDGEYGTWIDGKWKPASQKEVKQATRVYEPGTSYMWFYYSEGVKHVC